MKSFAFFALLLLAATAKAQTPADQIKRLQNDPNVVWIGEIYRDYEDIDNLYDGRNIDRYKPETLPDGNVLHSHKQNTTTLKRQAADAYVQDWDYPIWAQIIEPNVPLFADANLTQRISAENRNRYVTWVDTIQIFNPETFVVTLEPVIYQINPREIYAYRLRQLVYYNAKENMYYNLPLSIAPMKIEHDNNGKKIAINPLFWLPVVASSTPINPNQAPNMAVIRSVAMDMPLADAKILKKSKSFAEVNKMWLDYMRNQQNSILATWINDNPNKNILPPEEIDKLSLFHSDMVGLRINQTIGWDENKKMFTIATYSFTPLVNKKLDDGSNVVAPWFHVYPHRRFKTVPK